MKVVVKFTTYEGDAFYERVSADDVWKVVEGAIDRNVDIAIVEIIENMTEEEYHAIPVTSNAVEFFGGS